MKKLILIALTILFIATACSASAGQANNYNYRGPMLRIVRQHCESIMDEVNGNIADAGNEQEDEPETPSYTLPEPNRTEIQYIAKTLYGECRGIPSDTRKAAVAWVILNRVDDPRFPSTITGVITQRSQFSGYRSGNPVTNDLYNLALDVWYRWQKEKAGESDVGRVIPSGYLYFTGNGRENIFRTKWRSGSVWNWSLPTPYTS